MSEIEVRPIPAAETIAVRWPILRPGFPRETAIFDGDDAPQTLHFGSFLDGQLCGVASIYFVRLPERPTVQNAWQLRGMATLPEVRGAGAGRALLAGCEAAAHSSGAALIWCNARVAAAEFYRKHGWDILGAEFDIPTVGPHYRMMRAF